MRAIQPLPPRPLASDADAPPSIALPWVTALLSWLCVAVVVVTIAALHPSSRPAVHCTGIWATVAWVSHLATQTLPAALLPLAASLTDRMLPRWPRSMRWTLGMAAAGGAIPLVLISITLLMPPGTWTATGGRIASLGDAAPAAPMGALVGALVGMVMGLFARWRLGSVIVLPAVVTCLAYGLCLLRDDLVSPAYGVGAVVGSQGRAAPWLHWMWLAVWPTAPWAPWALSVCMPAVVGASLTVARSRARAGLPEGAVLADDPPASRLLRRLTLVVVLALVALGVGRYVVQRSRAALVRAVDTRDLRGVDRWLRLGVSPDTWYAGIPAPVLSRAVEGGDCEIVARLLEGGADANLTIGPSSDCFSRTALTAGIRSGNPEVVALLLEHGADPNFAAAGRPLDEAICRGDREVVAVLLDYGADPRARNHSGGTPLDYARSGGNADIAQLLESAAAR